MVNPAYMHRAIELAKKGCGAVNPNPKVGAVIVKNETVIGEGFHERYGELHAERNAFASLKDPSEARGATLYVTLEPCCHYGKTPPCTEAIIEHGIKKVVVGSSDPNPKVAGGGVKALKDAGIEVVEGFEKEACDALNPVFFHYIKTRTPYVVMKYAMTADGKIATVSGDSQWITNEACRQRVQELRNEYTGILCGIGTVLADDPMLNCRIEGARSPVRIICDSMLRIPLDSRIVRTAATYRTIVACTEAADAALEKRLREASVEVWRIAGPEGFGVDLTALSRRLGADGIDGVLVEGGGVLNESVLRCGIAKELCVFVGAKLFGGRKALTPLSGEGVLAVADAYGLKLLSAETFGDDVLLRYAVNVT